MAISHELSSEIATALFTAKERSPRELHDLKEMVLQIHFTLEQLMEKRHEGNSNPKGDSGSLTKAFGSSR